MDIKLRARLCAYSKVNTFDDTDTEHTCNMIPISKESIDSLFSHSSEVDNTTTAKGKSLIDSLF